MMPACTSAVRAVLAAAALAAVPLTAYALQSDDLVVRGRVIGADNSRVGGQTVVLHRVQDATGATVAEAVTTDDGEFVLRAPGGVDTASIYFVATRFDGELYIAPPFRASDDVPGQVLRIGVPGTSASALLGGGLAQPVGRPITSRSWFLLVIPLSGVLAVAMYAMVPRGRVSHRRALLIRIAELDERITSVSDTERASLNEERSRLFAQLRAG